MNFMQKNNSVVDLFNLSSGACHRFSIISKKTPSAHQNLNFFWILFDYIESSNLPYDILNFF